eukprot:comp21482_c0_seq1/m.29748 comp21482_c0_seq1/g.29748  ORF comp21482_c0_seq1/g.29748 comp21482_c0_seq1/m.29748 type:complete len:1272 (-) comp21482_c0_seq1:29-3844(-)
MGILEDLAQAEAQQGKEKQWFDQVPLFDFLEVGVAGEVDLVPVAEPPANPLLPNITTVPVGLPPVTQFDLAQVVEETFLSDVSDLAVHDFYPAQKSWSAKTNVEGMYGLEVSAQHTAVELSRDMATGEVIGYHEVAISGDNRTAMNSTSLLRAPAPASDFVRGKTTYMPFTPGGMSVVDVRTELAEKKVQEMARAEPVDFEHDLLYVPPGFDVGMMFDDGGKALPDLLPDTQQGKGSLLVTLKDIMSEDSGLVDWASDDEHTEEIKDIDEGEKQVQAEEAVPEPASAEDNAVDEILRISTVVGQLRANQRVDDGEQWAHMVDISQSVTDFHQRVPDMAKKYSFELDTFQKQAILRMENHESVFVAAHTSAGKTVVAEYAIALAAKHMTRAVYTSPIKALSNQKFRDFKDTFEDVGLLTGDVQINPEASCLIMTTEILRSMLYRGADIVRDIEWVIFDEVHYVNDAERGVVWEEVIIMLPPHVNLILLSATVPNTYEFAEWIGRTKKKHIYVISTLQRPVPLEHYLYVGPLPKGAPERKNPEIDETLFKILSAKKQFLSIGHSQAQDVFKSTQKKSTQNFGPKQAGNKQVSFQQDRNLYIHLVNMLTKKSLTPIVCFTFSKRKCEDNAYNLQSLDLTTTTEKSEIHVFFEKATSRLKGTDRQLPQVLRMKTQLAKGIGVHHSGLLPIMKEVVEMLFARGLVKILFATETFAMGVNMPARCVVFDSIRKHDGTGFRDLLPGEYIQMAGRAGRRGLDATGTVIIMCKGEVQEQANLHKMMTGTPTKLESQFRLTYNMILNLLRVEALKVEDMMKRSFSEYATMKEAPANQKAVKESEKLLTDLERVDCVYCTDLLDYYKTCSELVVLNHGLQATMVGAAVAARALQPGRVLVINTQKHRNSLCCVLKVEPTAGTTQLTVLVLCPKDTQTNANAMNSAPLPLNMLCIPEGPSTHDVTKIGPGDILQITTEKLKINPDDLIGFRAKAEELSEVTQQLLRLGEKNKKGMTSINPRKDLKINDFTFAENWSIFQSLQETLPTYQCTQCPELAKHYELMHTRQALQDKVQHLKHRLSDQNLTLLPEYEQRIRVLQELRYIDENRIVQLKGRVACEINTCDELLVTELIFDNILTDLTEEQIVALLSAMVFQEKTQSEPNLTEPLQLGKDAMLRVARRIGEIQMQCGLNQPVDDYLRSLKFGLVEVVHEWARGMPFAQITDLTDILEGSIVRCIVRLDETCRDVRNAARVIGDPILYQKMERASNLIKRDIVFAASLYTA